MTFYDICGSYFFYKKLMVGSRFPFFCFCCIPAVLLKNRAAKYYHIKMPKKSSTSSNSSNKKQKNSDELKTPPPSKISNSSAVETFIDLCAEDGKLYQNAFEEDIEASVKYELKDIDFEDKVNIAKELRELISNEKVRAVKKLKHFKETYEKDANENEEGYLNSVVEKSVTESGVIVTVSTDDENLLFEKKKLTNFIQVIDEELESRKKARSVLVWTMALEDIEKNNFAKADDNTSIIRSHRGSSSSSSASSSSIRRSSGVLTLRALQSPSAAGVNMNPVISEAGSPAATTSVHNSQA